MNEGKAETPKEKYYKAREEYYKLKTELVRKLLKEMNRKPIQK